MLFKIFDPFLKIFSFTSRPFFVHANGIEKSFTNLSQASSCSSRFREKKNLLSLPTQSPLPPPLSLSTQRLQLGKNGEGEREAGVYGVQSFELRSAQGSRPGTPSPLARAPQPSFFPSPHQPSHLVPRRLPRLYFSLIPYVHIIIYVIVDKCYV
ncbi:hypothetical protein RHGRI_017188 [Rhododendron griersonianum]|uniref:Uncharacterized protein n=1 Tax=Rhododendron griersonianum TaxID=479676 RepID=A0AAV6JWY2_9ERIC|nr:hypothetical protein RHGRI_017188 [Rhododendron griersonianum]